MDFLEIKIGGFYILLEIDIYGNQSIVFVSEAALSAHRFICFTVRKDVELN